MKWEELTPVILSTQYDHLTPEEARELLDEAIKNHNFFGLVEWYIDYKMRTRTT